MFNDRGYKKWRFVWSTNHEITGWAANSQLFNSTANFKAFIMFRFS